MAAVEFYAAFEQPLNLETAKVEHFIVYNNFWKKAVGSIAPS